MPFVTRKTLVATTALGIAGAGVLAGAVWAGLYDIAADTPHWRPVHALLETVRERSIEVRSASLEPPADLASEARIRQGAGNYEAMCAGCHGAPGRGPSELQRGLYPAPPALAAEPVEAREAFWVIKHGIKASGMPAWGHGMGDEYIWNLVAFLDALPKLDAAGYAAVVASSEGHSHGGGESHDHAVAAPPDAAEPAAAAPPAASAGEPPAAPTDKRRDAAPPATTTHLHADGKTHLHPAPAPKPAPAPTTHLHADGATHEHPPADAEPEPEPEPAQHPAHDH